MRTVQTNDACACQSDRSLLHLVLPDVEGVRGKPVDSREPRIADKMTTPLIISDEARDAANKEIILDIALSNGYEVHFSKGHHVQQLLNSKTAELQHELIRVSERLEATAISRASIEQERDTLLLHNTALLEVAKKADAFLCGESDGRLLPAALQSAKSAGVEI